jgi:carbonic anhydrase
MGSPSASAPTSGPWPTCPSLHPARTVRTDVNRVLWAEEIPQNVRVSGHVYDISTGLVTTVVNAKSKK